ncbi:MAG: ATP-NAD kinase family protein [Pseudomonadales bacterium]|nr:ATP-NAD kinase family protein [Pseudomonadales bacterium]
MFKIGLIINPLAGIGGAVGLKGSDGKDIVDKALSLGAQKRAPERVAQLLDHLKPFSNQLHFVSAPEEMGAQLCEQFGFSFEVAGELQDPLTTSAYDTENCAQAIVARGVNILLFAGGDGTARNIVNVVPPDQLCLGIPAGVKIHSGVYAVNVHGAFEIIQQLLTGELVSVAASEVRDIDENAFREGIVQAKYYGELLTPVEHRYLQHVKCGGREIEALVLQDIAEYLIEQMDSDTCYIIGPGTTTRALMDAMELPNTLLGVDIIKDQQLVANDVSEQSLLALVGDQPAKIIVTPIGGQGHIFGRGNHQISPSVIRRVGIKNIIVISPKSKLKELEGRPLLVDTYDEPLNESLSGLIEVVTGYEDRVVYRISC